MRFMKAGPGFVVVLFMSASLANAQSTTGTISGRVIDAQQLPVPGVTVNAESPNLQGIRTAVTSENGDYIITLLPSGVYKITFELSGFTRVERTVTIAPTQVLPVDATMGPAAVAETVEVVGRRADVLTQTAQVATNFSQELIANLATNRDINTALILAPSVHATGPGGNFSISGSMSFENLFMVNGVTVNENLRGQAEPNLVIEDAIQETTVASAGVSAEYGRFGGGVVNVITKSGGNLFSGSLRDTLINDSWRALVPKRDGDTFAVDTKLDKTVPTSIPERVHQGHSGPVEQHVQSIPIDGPEQPGEPEASRRSVHARLQRRSLLVVLRRGPLLTAPPDVSRERLTVHRSHQGNLAHRSVRPSLLVGHVLRRLHA